MPEFGQFQIIAPLKLTDHGSVNVALRVGDAQRRYVLKVFPVPAEVPRNGAAAAEDEDDEVISPRWEAQYFLDHARVQQKLIAGGATHWAAVHDLGMTPAGAYVVLDYCPRSVQTLLEEHATLSVSELHALASGVMAGLAELKRLRGRSHGDLKPANVLIAGNGELNTARILLTDPGPPAVAARTGEDGDLRSLGEMLRALVVGNSPAGSAGGAWDRLGRGREGWQAYIGGLLGAERGSPLGTLAAAQSALPRVAVDRPMSASPKRVAVAAVALLTIAASIVGTLLAINASQWKQYQQARAQWLGGLLAANDPRVRPSWYEDPQLHDAIDQMTLGHLWQMRKDTSAGLADSPSEYFQRRSAIAAESAIEESLSPGHWRKLGHLADLEAQFSGRGWKQPAEFLHTVAAAATPPSPDLAAGIDRVLRLSPKLDQSLPPIDAAWKQLSSATDNLTATGSPMLAAFAGHLLSSAADGIRLSEAGLSASGDTLASRLEFAKRLDHATRDATVDGTRFAAALANRIDIHHVTDGDVKTYLDTVAQYSIQHDAIGSALDTLHKALADMSQTIASSRPKASEAAALAADRARIEAQISAFGDTPFIPGDISDGTFSHRQQAIEAQIDGLNKYSHPESAREWIASLTPPPVTSPTLLSTWQNKLISLRAQAPALDRDRLTFVDVKATTGRFRDSLAELGRDFARPPGSLTPAFAAVASARREAVIRQALSAIDSQSGRLDPSAVQSARADFGRWMEQLALLNADFPLRQPILTPADRPDKAWAEKAGFWGDPAIQQLVAPDLARIQALAAVDAASRRQLAADLSAPAAEIALEAWRKIGQNTQPAWPTQAGELQAEADAERHLQTLFAAINDPVASAGLKSVRGESVTRWERAADAARSDQSIHSALALAPVFGVSPKNFDQLAWPMNFNFWLAATRDSARAGDESALDGELPRLSAFASSGERSVPASFATLGKADPREPFLGQQLGDTYALSLPGLVKPIDFRRVESGSIRPFYLTVREISFAEFSGVAEGAKAWGQVRALPWSARPGQADNRLGPMVWRWSGSADSAKMTTPDLWFSPDDANDFAPRFRSSEFNRNTLADAFGGNPTAADPMQQLSGEAALWFAGACGVRLPSSAEWQSAYAMFGKNVPSGNRGWNLRDATWDEEKQYLASVAAAGGGTPRWMDQEIYLPPGLRVPNGADARARTASDGTLLFRPADSGPGAPAIDNLIGNVFVYLCDAPAAFDALADKTPAAIHQFAAAHADALWVIGGSALSPPDVPIDKPQPIANPAACYADVGLRLAFTAPPRSRAERVRWALEDQPYVWPAKN